ncbi:putative transcription factor p65 homolog isoform X2 [Stegastes partitus]|uniref:Transcription factor p65 homolog isoform X2 n=1 Tax=Stegastes partitus TaxID=144197 RepID=A0A9Y4N8Y1_9TELE|nr:PREDICTED: transcription factor RelB isoform X2 [Stegastes partitus]
MKVSSHAMKDMDIFNGASEEPTPNPEIGALLPGAHPHFPAACPDRGLDLELLQGIIFEDTKSGASLPGPPPPPADLLGQNPLNQNHRRQNASPSSNPILVSRGAACKPNFSALRGASRPRDMASTHPSRVASSSSAGSSGCGRVSSKSSVSSQNQGDTEILERILEKPKLVIVEEPKDRGMRFRYECEGRSAGSILGASSTDTNKTQPAIEIQGPIDHLNRVTVTVSLVTKDYPHRPHPHCLVGKDCPNGSGICKVTFNPHSNRRHSFANLGIQCVRRKELDISLQKRKGLNIDPFQTGNSKGIEDMDMNSVRLCFQCELDWEDGRKDSLSPVVSNPIYDKKATTTSQLKICQLNQCRGSCSGKTEIYMLCDKVQKDDIEIIFRKGSWKANGEFAQTDVHRQIAIVFKTPPYQDQDLSEEVEVKVLLRRISDKMESEPVTFTYLPHNRDPYEVKRKRATMKSEISITEKPCMTAETTPPSEQVIPFLLGNQNMMSPGEGSCTAQPTAPAVVDMCYSEPADLDNAIFNQLLESPELWRALNDLDCGLPCDLPPADTNSTFANTDMNFNQNVSSYQPDLPYIDLHFNMLVNESHNPQSEPQDGMGQMQTEQDGMVHLNHGVLNHAMPQDSMVQVKMEEDGQL